MTVRVVPERGKNCRLVWEKDEKFLCSLGINEARSLIVELQYWLLINQNKWKRRGAP